MTVPRKIKKDKIPRIVLVDDDEDDRELFKDAIRVAKLEISLTTIAGGIELMKKLNTDDKLPDIIFLDLNMPKKNGHECLQEIRANDKFRNIPIIIYSTSSHYTEVEECFKGGANLYIIKPDSFANLVLMLKKIFALDIKNLKPVEKKNFVLSFKESK